jgi:hypothetical protein
MSNEVWNFYDSAVEIKLAKSDDFLKVKETLTRIGVASKKEKTLYQSCHILHKKGKFFIVHFKEMFALDGKEASFTENDIGRRNTIANLLVQWKLIGLVNPDKCKEPVVPIGQIKILRYDEKKDWTLTAKYSIGNISTKQNESSGENVSWINERK